MITIYSVTFFSPAMESGTARLWREDLDEAVKLAHRKDGTITAYVVDEAETEHARMLLDNYREASES